MNIPESIKTVNEILKSSNTNKDFLNKLDEPYKTIGSGESKVSFIGYDNISKYQNGLEKLYKIDKEIYNTISLKTFEKYLVSLFRTLRKYNRKCNAEDLTKIFSEIKSTPIRESEVLYELYGCKMTKGIIHLGDFTIYNYEKSSDLLFKKYPHLSNGDLFFERRQSNIFLSVKVKTRENSKSTELADKIVKVLENAFSYMISDFEHQRSIGVFNYRKWNLTRRIICNDSNLGFSGTKDIVFLVDIDDPFFTDKSQGNDKIWKLITKKGKSEIEKRLLQAIEWIGKGVYDKDYSKALVQFVFSIEGMLKYDEKTMITPSIVSQISDWLAFIIQDNPQKRKEIAKFFKQTYGKRSAIVHGGSKLVELEDLKIAHQIAKLMTINFLTEKPFCGLKTMQELSEYINKLKFK